MNKDSGCDVGKVEGTLFIRIGGCIFCVLEGCRGCDEVLGRGDGAMKVRSRDVLSTSYRPMQAFHTANGL